MLIWIIALFLFIALGVMGYYVGALRGAFTFAGLLVAALLAIPLGGVFNWVVGIFGLEHPVPLAFIGPVGAWVVILICFKAGGMAVHKQVDTYYKYKASDTVRLLFERMNARVGIAVGLLNGFVYLVVVAALIYVFGYFAIQVRTSERDSFAIRTLARLAQDMKETQIDQAVAAFIPKADLYYTSTDVLALIFKNHLLQNRLATYPPFLPLSERGDYKQIAARTEFQDFWIKGPTIQEFRSHDAIRQLVESKEQYENTMALLGGDPTDLKEYLETGKSKKYDDEAILGRWDFDGPASFALMRKRKPNMTLQEQRRVRAVLATVFRDSQLVAQVDKKLIFKLPAAPTTKSLSGEWETSPSGGYTLSLTQDGNDVKVDVLVEGRRMTFTKDGYALVYDKQ